MDTPTRSLPTIRAGAVIAAAALAAASLTVALPASGAEPDEPSDLAGSSLYVNPFSTTLEAAQLLGSIPSAEWITEGTPAEAQAAADKVVSAAAAAGRMPVIVAYNLPFRDCAQYSAGGAAPGR